MVLLFFKVMEALGVESQGRKYITGGGEALRAYNLAPFPVLTLTLDHPCNVSG